MRSQCCEKTARPSEIAFRPCTLRTVNATAPSRPLSREWCTVMGCWPPPWPRSVPPRRTTGAYRHRHRPRPESRGRAPTARCRGRCSRASRPGGRRFPANDGVPDSGALARAMCTPAIEGDGRLLHGHRLPVFQAWCHKHRLVIPYHRDIAIKSIGFADRDDRAAFKIDRLHARGAKGASARLAHRDPHARDTDAPSRFQGHEEARCLARLHGAQRLIGC